VASTTKAIMKLGGELAEHGIERRRGLRFVKPLPCHYFSIKRDLYLAAVR
jgi:hypothetical protein